MAGRKRFDESGEKRDAKLMCYVTPSFLDKIQKFAHMQCTTTANFVVSVLEDYINPRIDKLNAFLELNKESENNDNE